MGRTVRSISSLSDNHSNSFQVAARVARHPSRKRSRAIGVRIFLERELWGINEVSFSDSYV